MKKNAQFHLFLETELLEKIKEEALERNISPSELCRQKLRQNHQLSKIEYLLENLTKTLSKRKTATTSFINSQSHRHSY